MWKDTPRKRNQIGASLVEMALLIPILFLIMAGIFNISSFILQMQVMAEAARHGARSAAYISSQTNNCNTIMTEGKERFQAYIAEYSSTNDTPALLQKWGTANICLDTPEWDGLSEKYIVMSISTNKEDNCVFCWAGIASLLQVQFSSKFLLQADDCFGEALWQCS